MESGAVPRRLEVVAFGRGWVRSGSRAGLDVLPAGLPAYDLSTPTGYEEDRTSRVYWQHATYDSHRGAQIVRRHYRDLLLERGWRITSNDPVRDGAALITATRGTREVTIRITPKDEGVEDLRRSDRCRDRIANPGARHVGRPIAGTQGRPGIGAATCGASRGLATVDD